MATYLQMQQEVLAYGFDTNTYQARVKNWLNEAQSRIARSVEILDLYTQSNIVTVAGTSSYALPADCITVDGIADPPFFSDTWFEPQYKILLAKISANPVVSGHPTEYSVTATSIVFYPVPDLVYTLVLTYYKRPTDLSADGDISILPIDYHDVMVSYALQRAYRAEDDVQMAQFYRNEFIQGLRDLASDTKGAVSDAPRQVRGTWG